MTLLGQLLLLFFSCGRFGVLIPIVSFPFFFFCVFHLYLRRYKAGLLFFLLSLVRMPPEKYFLSVSLSLGFVFDPK